MQAKEERLGESEKRWIRHCGRRLQDGLEAVQEVVEWGESPEANKKDE